MLIIARIHIHHKHKLKLVSIRNHHAFKAIEIRENSKTNSKRNQFFSKEFFDYADFFNAIFPFMIDHGYRTIHLNRIAYLSIIIM